MSVDDDDDGDRFSSYVDEELDFEGEEGEVPGAPHSESVFVLEDDEAGRESYLVDPSQDELVALSRRDQFAEDFAHDEAVATHHSQVASAEAETFVDAEPTALDAAAGLAVPALRDAAEAEALTEPAAGESVVRRHLRGLLEALLFVSDRPLKVADLAGVARAETREVRAVLEELSAAYRDQSRGFQLDEFSGGFQFRTSPTFAPFVREMTQLKPVKLTRAQVETLAIVAYRQPVTRPEVEDIRGVDAGAVLKLLLDRDLVRVLGKKEEPGRPLLYGTSSHFLAFFGLKSLRDLPTLREFTELSDESLEVVERELGDVLPDGPRVAVTAVVGDASVASVDEDPEAIPVADDPEKA